MKQNIKYTSDGKFAVYSGKNIIAKSYVGQDGYEVRVKQGMSRCETWDKIISDCPDFAAANEMNPNIVPRLFSK
jgi:hypothetical protein